MKQESWVLRQYALGSPASHTTKNQTRTRQWHAGDNVGTGKDYTLFSTIDGVVVYQKKADRPKVSVYPLDHPKGSAAAAATHTTEAKAGVGSRKERRRAAYKPRGAAQQQQKQEQPVATVAMVASSAQP
jgi:hypothetical protein